MTRYPSNRNGHLCRFEDFAVIKRSTREIVQLAIAHRNGTLADEPMPAAVHSTKTLDLVRYRLNSRRLSAAFETMGDTHTDYYDEAGHSEWSARFGVIDRESGDPVAMLWIIDDPNQHRGFEIADISLSAKRDIDASEMLEILEELDIPPGHNTCVDDILSHKLDIWFNEGEWEIRQPRELLVFRFASTCFSVRPVIEDTMDVFVELDPEIPLDGGGDTDAAYWNRDRYRSKAHEQFWPICPGVRAGFSSWVSSGEPRLVKITGYGLDSALEPASPAGAAKATRPKP
jgi:hypothetical protein|nr:hypothetical protein [Neorhizobium tomejilense]